MSGGLAAPAGYLWCRGRRGLWHFLRAAELDGGGALRTTARSVCGLCSSLTPGSDGREEVRPRATQDRLF